MKPLLFTLLALIMATPLRSQTATPHASVLMLSDIHLDPFHDPAKLPQLRSTPVTGWRAILDALPSPTQAAEFAQLQSTCGARGVDTPVALLESTLRATYAQQPHPLFVTVSGDLMAHEFDCRFRTLAPTATAADYSAFAARTVAFVALQLRLTFPRTPIYLALGNNDSGCKDYREDSDSAFLQADGSAFAADLITPADRIALAAQFSQLGDYTVALPIPHTRIIVLQNIFESKKYTACGGTASPDPTTTPAELQITWLRTQLDHARAAGEHVWVMAHIPPGIDAYSTFTRTPNVCSAAASGKPAKPEMFLASDALAATLADFPGTIRLALFGHTHMDELRVFTSPDGTPIPGKLVPSVTPVNGNTPAFTVAQVDTHTATLQDYTVFVASNKTGIDTTWSGEYTYSTTYHLPDFSGPSLATLTSGFHADRTSATPASKAYQRFYFAGDPLANIGISGNLKAAAMQAIWPAYACTLTRPTQAGFLTCACPATTP